VLKPPFNTLRACFILLAIVVAGQIVVTVGGAATCYYLYIIGGAKIGDCAAFGTQAREVWAELLAVILALLFATSGKPPPPRPPKDKTDAGTPKAHE
jgi:hypothetical protein